MSKFYTSAVGHRKVPYKKKRSSVSRKESPEKYNHRRKLKQTIDKYKKKQGCQICGYNRCASALDFHHMNPSEKSMEIGTMIFRGFSIERIEKEMKKCRVVCKNCHIEIHEGVTDINADAIE